MSSNRRRWFASLVGAGALISTLLVAGGGVPVAAATSGQAAPRPHPTHRVPKAPKHTATRHSSSAPKPHISGPNTRRPHQLGIRPQLAPSPTIFTVNSTADSPLGNPAGTTCVDSEGTPKCSLRAAVQAANNLGKPVQIDLGSHDYNLNVTANGVLAAHNKGGTSIIGNGRANTTVQVTNGSDSVFLVDQSGTNASGTLTLSALTVSGGQGHVSGPHTYGGGIDLVAPNGALVLNNVLVTDNEAYQGGGVACSDSTHNMGGSVWITNSAITGNTADYGGGGLYQYWCGVTIVNTNIAGNNAQYYGGGIENDYGSMSITDGAVHNNSAGVAGSQDGVGGGFYDEYVSLDIDGTSIDHNVAQAESGDAGYAGGLYEYGSLLTTNDVSIDHNNAKGVGAYGGGLEVDYGSQVALHGTKVDNNTTGDDGSSGYCEYGGGGIYIYAGDDYYAASVVVDQGSSVSNNTTGGIVVYNEYGGGLLKISDSTLSGNSADGDYDAGAICVYAEYGEFSVHLKNDTFDQNTATGTYSAGAVMAYAYYSGGIDLTVNGGTFTDNKSTGDSGTGGIIAFSEEYSNVTADITGTTFSGNASPNAGYGGAIQAYDDDDYSPVSLELTNDTFTNNSAGSAAAGKEGQGGAIYAYYYVTVNVTNTTITGNRAYGNDTTGGYGGGVYLDTEQTSSWDRVTIADNRATGNQSYGGGVYSDGYVDRFVRSTIDNNRAEWGGGVYEDSSGYSLRFNQSTVSNNRAGSDADPGAGGGLYLYETALSATNSTFANNFAVGSTGQGGAIYMYSSSAAATLDFVTISKNAAAEGGGIYGIANGGSIRSSILTRNSTTPGSSTPSNCAFGGSASSLSSAGHNVVATGCVMAAAVADVSKAPNLGPLADNGGPTMTMALKAKSSALGRGGTDHPKTDQRGVVRPATADAGAFERP